MFEGRNPGVMPENPSDDLAERLADLEREVRQLRARVAALERAVSTTEGQHSTDRTAIRQKVVYDWQA